LQVEQLYRDREITRFDLELHLLGPSPCPTRTLAGAPWFHGQNLHLNEEALHEYYLQQPNKNAEIAINTSTP
jgi:hypothetical protein